MGLPKKMIGALGRGAVVAALINGCALLINLALQVYFARALGPAELGEYSFVLSWLSIAVLIGVGGVDSVIVREVAALNAQPESSQPRDAIRSLLFWGNRRVLLQSLALGAGLALVAAAIPSDIGRVALAGSVLLPLWALAMNRQAMCRGYKSVLGARLPEVVVRPLCQAGILYIALTFAGQSSSSLLMMGAHCAAAALALAVGWVIFRPKLPPPAPTRAAALPNWGQGTGRLMLVALLMVLWNEVDKIFLGLFRDYNEVGVYAVAARLATLGVFGVEAIGVIAAPLVAEYSAARKKIELEALLGRIALGLCLVSVPLCIALIVIGPYLLPLFGPQFSAAYLPLVILCVGNALSAMFLAGGFALSMTGNEGQLLRVTAVSSLALIALVSVGSYYGGMHGAALATSAGLIVRGLLLHDAAKRTLHIRIAPRAALREIIRGRSS